jgi:hypothetical protein
LIELHVRFACGSLELIDKKEDSISPMADRRAIHYNSSIPTWLALYLNYTSREIHFMPFHGIFVAKNKSVTTLVPFCVLTKPAAKIFNGEFCTLLSIRK